MQRVRIHSQNRGEFILFALLAWILVAFTEIVSGGDDTDTPVNANGSTHLVTWRTNTSLGFTDRLRPYGKGFELTPEEELALDKVRLGRRTEFLCTQPLA